MTAMTRQEFRAAVAASIENVTHLYGEVGKLWVDLRESLKSGSPALVPVGGISFKPPKAPDRVVVRTSLGQVFDDSIDADEEDEEVEEAEEPEDEDEDASTRQPRGPLVITPATKFLLVQTMLADGAHQGFEPVVRCMLIGGWKLGDAAAPDFQIARWQLRRIIAAVGPGARRDDVLRSKAHAKAVGRKFSGNRVSLTVLSDVHSMPLFDVRSGTDIANLANQCRSLWQAAQV
jgi:hypothetical protein